MVFRHLAPPRREELRCGAAAARFAASALCPEATPWHLGRGSLVETHPFQWVFRVQKRLWVKELMYLKTRRFFFNVFFCLCEVLRYSFWDHVSLSNPVFEVHMQGHWDHAMTLGLHRPNAALAAKEPATVSSELSVDVPFAAASSPSFKNLTSSPLRQCGPPGIFQDKNDSNNEMKMVTYYSITMFVLCYTIRFYNKNIQNHQNHLS